MADEKDQFAGMEEVKTQTIKWGKVGDWLKGTLTDNTREVPNTLNPEKNEMQRVFEFKVKGGSFHNINDDRSVSENSTLLPDGTFWSVFAKPALASQMRNSKLGQIIGLSFVEERASKKKGFNPTKIIKVYLGEMDSTYQGEQSGEVPKL